MSVCFMISMAMKIMKERRSKWRPPLSSLQLLLPARKHHAVWNHTIKQRKTLKRHNYRHYWSCLVKRFQYWLSILSLLRGVGSLQLVIQRPVDTGTSAAETLFLASHFVSIAKKKTDFFSFESDFQQITSPQLCLELGLSFLPLGLELATWRKRHRTPVPSVPCFCALCFFFVLCLFNSSTFTAHWSPYFRGIQRVVCRVMSDHVLHILCLLLLCLLSTI